MMNATPNGHSEPITGESKGTAATIQTTAGRAEAAPPARRRGRSWTRANTRSFLLAAALLLAPPITDRAEDIPVPPPGASRRVDEIKQRGALRVAVLDEYPWLKQNPAGTAKPFAGPAWRLAEEYASRLGVRLETVPVGFDNKVSILSTGAVDITIAPLLETPERDKEVDVIAYSLAAQCLFGLADNPKVAQASRIDDLDRPDITIAYIKDTPQGAWLLKRLPRAARRGVPGNLTDVAVDEILSRRADATMIDKFFFAGLAKKVPGLTTLPKAYLTSQELPIPIGMAVAKEQPAFLAWLRAVAEAVKPQVEAEEAEVVKAGS